MSSAISYILDAALAAIAPLTVRPMPFLSATLGDDSYRLTLPVLPQPGLFAFHTVMGLNHI